jgi:hypothetical protein
VQTERRSRPAKIGPKWISEVNDVRAFFTYRSSPGFSLSSWVKSYAGVRGCEIFARDDLRPFLYLMVELLRADAGMRRRSRVSTPPRLGSTPDRSVAGSAGRKERERRISQSAERLV